jgi:2-oxoglutarate/2-oxoacid ferredoxin oxidoreductase subunit alpha
MYELTANAFNLADRFRIPVFLMADEIIGHMREKLTIPDRVELTPRKPLAAGVPPFHADKDMVPGFPEFGKGFRVHVTGLTHDERGYPCATSPKVHEGLVMRLVNKVESVRKEIADYEVINPGARVVFISYGAPARSVAQVLHDTRKDDIGHLRLRMVWPFPDHALKEFPNAEKFIVPELNLGQVAREIERHTSVPVIQVPKLGGDLHIPADLRDLAEADR